MKKNILFLIESLRDGGSEKTISNIAKEIAKKHNVLLVVANKDKDYEYKGKEIVINEFVSKNPFKRIKGIRKLKRIKKEFRIDISISFITAYNLYNVLSKYKDKIYISIRNHLSTKKESLIAKISTKYTNRKADKTICCANSIKEDQINNFKAIEDKTIVIENFTNVKSSTNKSINNTIITVGRLTSHKGQEHIIKALSIVKESINNIELLILGRGSYKNHLEKLIKKYKLEDNVKLIGFTNNIEEYYKKAKLFILASDYEGFNNSILEALTSSIPVIATDSPGGNKEILDNGKYGILIPTFANMHNIDDITDKEKDLARNIIELLTNKDKYNYYKKQAKIRSKYYNKDKIIKKWLSIIEEE